MTPHDAERLSAYLDGVLDVGAHREVEAHLHACAECRERLELLRAVDSAAAGLPVSAPDGYFDDFASRVRRRIEREQAPPIPTRPPTAAAPAWRVPIWGWAAAAVVLLAVVTPMTLREAKPPAVAVSQAPRSAPAQERTKAAAERPARLDAARAPAEEETAGRPRPRRAPLEPGAPRAAGAGGVPGPSIAAVPAPAAPPPQGETGLPPPRGKEAFAPPRGEEGFAASAPEEKREHKQRAAGQNAVQESMVRDADLAHGVEPQASAPADADAAGAEGGIPGGVVGGVPGGVVGGILGGTPGSVDEAHAREAGVGAAAAEFQALANWRPQTIGEWRVLRDRWLALSTAHSEAPLADEAAVRGIAAAAEVVKRGGSQADARALQAAGEAYLERDRAAQKERVRRLLVEAGRRY